MQKPTKKEIEQEKARLGTYVTDYNDAYSYVKNNYHDLWFRCYSVFNNKRVKIGYNSVSDNFIPETRTIVESLVANVAGGSPRFAYVPTDEEQETDTEVLSELMDYYWDCNHMSTKAQSWVRDSILYGTGVLHVTWNAEKNIPQIDNVPLMDFVIDPTATTLENARFSGFRYLADLEALKKLKVLDPQTGEYVPKYKNLDAIESKPANKNSSLEMDKQKKEQLIGSTLGINNDRQIEVIILYYQDSGKVVEIANRSQIIREIESPYQIGERTRPIEVMVNGEPKTGNKKVPGVKPFLPFAVLRNTIDPSLFYGTGDVEVILDRQEALNDIENLDMDNLHYLNNVMWRIDPAYEDMAADIESSPGIVIPVPRNALEPIQKPRIDNDLDVKKQEIKEEMRRATAADEIMQGSTMTRGRATATEISAATNSATARFKTKVTNIESEGFAQLGSILFHMSQIFVDAKTVVRIVGPEGVSFKDFDPTEYSGYYEPHVKLDTTIKEQKIEQGQKLNQMYQIILNNPVVNQQEAVRFIIKSLGGEEEEIKRLLEVPTPPVDPTQGGMPGMPGQPADPNAQGQEHPLAKLFEQLQIKFADLPEDVKMQLIEQIFGITPQGPSPIQQNLDLKSQSQHEAGLANDNKHMLELIKHKAQADAPQPTPGGNTNEPVNNQG